MSDDAFKYALFIVWGIVITALILCLGGCSEKVTDVEVDGSTQNPFSVERLTGDCYIVTDSETGVEYVMYGHNAGYGYGLGICPRLNADGSVMVADEG